jgi:hypothetical protein
VGLPKFQQKYFAILNNLDFVILMGINNHSYTSLIFFVHPGPKGSEENQFTPLGVGVDKLIFKRFWLLYLSLRKSFFYDLSLNTNITVLCTFVFRWKLLFYKSYGALHLLIYPKQRSCEIFVETHLINPNTGAEHRNI